MDHPTSHATNILLFIIHTQYAEYVKCQKWSRRVEIIRKTYVQYACVY